MLIGKKMLDQIAADVPTTAEFVHARHILCKAAADCQDALARLDAGDDFGTVAKAVSLDETSKERGGDLDWVTRGMLPSQRMEDAMFELQAGQRSDIVETDYGFHIVEVLERDPSRELDAAAQLRLKEKKLFEWLAERRQASTIVVYVEDLKDVAGSASAAPAAASATPGG